MAYAVTILISVLFCGVLGRAMQVLGDKVRLLEVYVAFALMMVTAGFIHVWSDDELNTFEMALAMACGALSMTAFCLSRCGFGRLGFARLQWEKSMLRMVGLSVCIAVLNVAVSNLWVYSLSLFSIEHQAQCRYCRSGSGQHGKIAWLIYICALAPLAECCFVVYSGVR